MKRSRRLTAIMLLWVSMIMLAIPVVPHHHHADGQICMKNDLTNDCCANHNHSTTEHCCCDTGCLTTHYVNPPQQTDGNHIQPDFFWVTVLFADPFLELQLLPSQKRIRKEEAFFRESLHGIFIVRAMGMRAPPCA